jgi:hypothetical protein
VNKFELIQQMNLKQLANFLCDQHECEDCPKKYLCNAKDHMKCGWTNFLERDVNNGDRISAGMPVVWSDEEINAGKLVLYDEGEEVED